MSEREQLRMALGRAIHSEVSAVPWSDLDEPVQGYYLRQADAVLAVLDQQGWVSPDVHALQIRAWEAKAAEVKADHDAMSSEWDEMRAERDAALREAARYEPYAWCHGDEGPIERMADENRTHGCERCVPLYRQVTEGEEG